MKPKTLVLMGVAIICGLVASYMTSRLIAENKEEVDVWKAKDKYVQWKRLTDPENMFEKAKMLKTQAPKNHVQAITPNDLVALKNKPLRRELNAGDILTLDDVMQKGASLDTALPAGKVAKAVRITPETAVAYFVVPGTHVDVYHVRQNEAKRILEDVLIRAIDLGTERPEQGPGLVGATATLELDSDQARELLRYGGAVELVLRSSEDWGKTSKSVTALMTQQLPPPPPPPPVVVTMPTTEEKEPAKPVDRRKYMTFVNGPTNWVRIAYPVDEKGNVTGMYEIIQSSTDEVKTAFTKSEPKPEAKPEPKPEQPKPEAKPENKLLTPNAN